MLQNTANKFITIEGNIGAGKTTLATMLANDLNFRLILSKQMPKKYQPNRGLKTLSVISLLFLSSFTIIYLFSI